MNKLIKESKITSTELNHVVWNIHEIQIVNITYPLGAKENRPLTRKKKSRD